MAIDFVGMDVHVTLGDSRANGSRVIRKADFISSSGHLNMTKNEHVYAICCRMEVAGDVISSENVRTIDGYAVLNFEAASLCSFRGNQLFA